MPTIMKVRDLIKALSSLDPGMSVYCICEDGGKVQTYIVDSVDEGNVQFDRDSAGKPTVKFGTDGHPLAILTISADF